MAETTSKAAPKKTAGKAATVKAPAAAKPATASKAAPKPSPAKTPSKKTAVKKAPATASVVVTEEQRYRMIAEAAYYRAESNQFKSDPIRDWIDAEKDISILLSGTR